MAKARILVVEDEAIIAQDIQSTLVQFGYEVPQIVSSVKDVIQSVYVHKPDLVLMDIRIKGDLDGIDAAEVLYSGFNIPVIFLTAFADDETLSRAKLAESYGFINKPYHEKELYITIEFALHKHKMRKALVESKGLLDSILKSLPCGLISADIHGRITFMNENAVEILKVKQSEIHNKEIKDLFSLADGSLTSSAGLKKIVLKDQSEKWVDIAISPLCDKGGEMIGKLYTIKNGHQPEAQPVI